MNSTQGWLHAGQDIRLFYTVDDYTDPWRKAQTVVLVHGLAESGEAWRAWVPYLARHYRVVRLDQRGFGQSTPMPQDYTWTLDMLAGDLARLVTQAAGGRVHVIGAKIGATVSARFATLHPELVKTLTLVGLPVVGPKRRIGCDPVQYGLLEWARSTMLDRLGASASSEMLEWWSQLMAKTHLSTFLGFTRAVGTFDVTADLPRIVCPVLLLNSNSALHPISESDGWRRTLRDMRMEVIAGDGFHAAAVSPKICTQFALDFMMRRGADAL